MHTQMLSKPDKAGVVIFPPLLYFIAIISGIVAKYIYPTPYLSKSLAFTIGAILLLAAITILRQAASAMIKHKTTINPSGATTTIVKNGIYRYTRNPMYLSFTLVYIAVLIALNAWAGLLLLVPLLRIVRKGIIDKEEKYLTQKFGDEYLSYKKKVNRWL